jgi:hypothetical protein
MDHKYVCLATIGDINLAHVAAARLESEGLSVRLHSEALGPFPVTVGRLAETQLWVVADQAAEATQVLEDVGVECHPQDL